MVNQETLKGRWTEVKGKLQEKWGELSNDESLRFSGDVNQLVGHIHEKTGESRENIEHFLDEIAGASDEGGSTMEQMRTAVSGAAAATMHRTQEAGEYVSQAVTEGYQQAQDTVRRHPLESLAVCFGVGIVAGLVIGMSMRSR